MRNHSEALTFCLVLYKIEGVLLGAECSKITLNAVSPYPNGYFSLESQYD